MTMIDLFDRGARAFPDRVCYVHDDGTQSWTYREVEDLTHRIANALADSAIGARTYAVYSPNHSLVFPCILAGQRRRMRWISLNARAGSPEVEKVLRRYRCEVLFFHSQFERDVVRFSARLPALRLAIPLDHECSLGPDVTSWSSAHPSRSVHEPSRPESICALLTTGGTTGVPKAAQISNRAMLAMSGAALTYLHFDAPPVHLVIAPLSHAAGAVHLPLLALGATHVILGDASPGCILQAVQRFQVNIVFLPPTLIYALLAWPGVETFDFRSLRYLLYSAAPIAPEKLRQAIALFGPVLIQTYGQTEAPLWLTCLTREDHTEALEDASKAERLSSCGRPTMYGRLEVMDESGTLVGPNSLGEIVYRGPLLMSGYYRDRRESVAASAFGWHHTGDVGYRTEDGFIYLVDRMKDMIISGGFNIYPAEIEKVILSDPAVQDCAVIGAPHERWGEAVTAVLELKSGRTISPDAIMRLCRERLGSVKTPKSVDVWPELPRTPVGKVSRRSVREAYWRELERKI